MDYKKLIELLKNEGLEITEEAAKKLVPIFMNFIKEAIVKSENKFDDALLLLMPLIEKQLLAYAEEINKND